MKKFFPYNPASTQVIELEAHKIVGGKIRLNSIPKEGSLTVRGFVEAQSAAHLQSNEFFCSYRADTQYREANCLVFFYPGRSGQTVYCSYITVGTVVTADDMNEIGDFMTAANKIFDDNKLTHTELKNSITAARSEARTSLTEHNQNVAAHSDIRDSVRGLNISNTEAHIAIRNLIDNLDADLRQHKADELAARTQALLAHNSDGTAHSDIRNKLTDIGVQVVDLRADINGELDAIKLDIASLSSSVAANQADIAALEIDLDSSVADLNSALNSESTLRAAQVENLSSNLNSEVTLRATQVESLSSALNSEVTLRAAQVSELNSGLTNLANEVSGLSSAFSMISGGFSGDLSEISSAVVELQNDIETLDTALANKVDTSTFNTALAQKADATALANKVNNATFATLQTAVTNLQGDLNDLDSIVDGKVDKDGSKVLSTNDFTDAYKNKLDGLSAYTFGEGFAMSGTTVNCTVQGAAVLDTVELTVEGGMWLVV